MPLGAHFYGYKVLECDEWMDGLWKRRLKRTKNLKQKRKDLALQRAPPYENLRISSPYKYRNTVFIRLKFGDDDDVLAIRRTTLTKILAFLTKDIGMSESREAFRHHNEYILRRIRWKLRDLLKASWKNTTRSTFVSMLRDLYGNEWPVIVGTYDTY